MNIISELLFGIVESISIFNIYITVANRKDYIKKSKGEILIFIFLYTIFSYWITISFPVGFHTVIITLFTMVILSAITRTNILTSLISTIAATSFLMLLELFIAVILNIILDISLTDIKNNNVIKTQFALLVKPLQVVLSFVFLKKVNNSFLKQSDYKFKDRVINYIFIAVYFIVIYVVSLNYMFTSTQNLITHEILFLLIFIICIFFGIFDYKQKLIDLKKDHQLKLQEEYIKNLETLISIIRREKHDFTNHISTIYAMCSLNKSNTIEKIKTYLQSLSHNLKSSYHFFNSGNYYVDGLLAVKSNYAFEHEINFDVDLEQPLSLIDVNDNDLIRIIGNIIDNAFETVESLHELDNKIVSLCTYVEDNVFYIDIANNGPKISENVLKNIFNQGFTTKHDKKEHGLGLYIVKKIISKNKGEISVTSSKDETQFLINFAMRGEVVGEISG